MEWQEYIKNKKVLYITTKDTEYIRVVQELEILRRQASSLRLIGSGSTNYLVRILWVYFSLLFVPVRNYDTVFVGFAPQLVLPLWGRRFKRADLIIDFFISFYDTLCCDRKRCRPKSIFGRLLHGLDEKSLKMADAVICDSNAHGRYFSREFGMGENKLFTLYLKADCRIYYPRGLARPAELSGKFLVFYFASGFPLQGTEVVMKAMALLQYDKSLRFVYVGPIRDRRLKRERPVSDTIEYKKWLSQEELAKQIDAADLCLAGHFSAGIEKARRVIPGKAFIYQAMGKRMILGDNEANRELFAESCETGFVKMGDERALADKILQMKEMAG